MYNNFPNKKAYNPGGYREFLFLPDYSIETFPMILNGSAQVPVGLAPGATWFAGYSTPETLSFTEESKTDANGTWYQQVISGFAPGDKPELVALMENLEKGRFLVMLRDSQGIRRLVGTPYSPLELQSNFNSGDKRSDLKGFAFKFTGQSLFRAPVAAL